MALDLIRTGGRGTVDSLKYGISPLSTGRNDEMKMEHVPGRDKGRIMLYALSTCGWCKRTRELLQELGVEHSYVYVDLLPPDEMEQALQEVERHNPRGSFPTLIIGSKVIVGFREQEIREALR
jgi:glutaredoxin-like protein NrdH